MSSIWSAKANISHPQIKTDRLTKYRWRSCISSWKDNVCTHTKSTNTICNAWTEFTITQQTYPNSLYRNPTIKRQYSETLYAVYNPLPPTPATRRNKTTKDHENKSSNLIQHDYACLWIMLTVWNEIFDVLQTWNRRLCWRRCRRLGILRWWLE